jgi:hypothetical protein
MTLPGSRRINVREISSASSHFFQRAADSEAHHDDFGLRAVQRRDLFKLVPGGHRLADLEEAGGGV